nr:hypothetical protein [uncultured Cupriavidus sp.]
MSLATLHTDARKLLAAASVYPTRMAARAAIGIAVHFFRTEPALAYAMQSWHMGANSTASEPPPALSEGSRAPAFALIGVATHKPQLLIGALAAFAPLPILIICRFI